MSARPKRSLYQVIVDDVRDRISRVTPGARLPTESELCAEYSTTRTTVRKAYDALVEDGLVERRHGVGYFVRQDTATVWPMTGVDGTPADPWRAAAEGRPHHHVVTVQTLPATHQVAGQEVGDLLSLGPAGLAARRAALGYLDGEPAAIVHTYMPSKMARAAFMNAAAPYDVDEAMRAGGWELDAVSDTVTVRVPASHEADALELPAATPVVDVVRVMVYGKDADRRPVLVHYVFNAFGAKLLHTWTGK